MVLGNLYEQIWKYWLDDIGVPYLLLSFVGYAFMGIVLWCMTGVNDNDIMEKQ